MTKKEIEELTDEEIVALYKVIDDFIIVLEKELVGDNSAK